jgi:hypothetical protein
MGDAPTFSLAETETETETSVLLNSDLHSILGLDFAAKQFFRFCVFIGDQTFFFFFFFNLGDRISVQ